MPGRHEAPGLGPFLRQLGLFAAKLAVAGGAVAVALTFGQGWWDDWRAGSAAPATSTTPTVAPSTTPTSAAPAAVTSTTATTVAAPTTTTTVAVRPPEELVVLVLNGTGQNLLAARVTDEVRAAGYQALEADNADRSYDTSRLWYAPGFAPEALALAERFPDAVVEAHPDPDPPADLVVVLGASYEG